MVGENLKRTPFYDFHVAANAKMVPFAGFDAGRQVPLSNEDSEALSQLSEVATIAPRLRVSNRFTGQAISIVRGDESVSFNIMGDHPEFLEIKPYIIEEGRFINQFDIDGNRKVAVIGLRVRDELFEPGEPVIGEYIRIGGVPFKVVDQKTG